MPTKKSTKTVSIKPVKEVKKKVAKKVAKKATPKVEIKEEPKTEVKKVFTVTYPRGVTVKTFDDKATAIRYAEVTGGKVNEE